MPAMAEESAPLSYSAAAAGAAPPHAVAKAAAGTKTKALPLPAPFRANRAARRGSYRDSNAPAAAAAPPPPSDRKNTKKKKNINLPPPFGSDAIASFTVSRRGRSSCELSRSSITASGQRAANASVTWTKKRYRPDQLRTQKGTANPSLVEEDGGTQFGRKRVRAVPHIEGNWATHVHIPLPGSATAMLEARFRMVERALQQYTVQRQPQQQQRHGCGGAEDGTPECGTAARSAAWNFTVTRTSAKDDTGLGRGQSSSWRGATKLGLQRVAGMTDGKGLHISLSRTVYLRHHEIEPFVDALRDALAVVTGKSVKRVAGTLASRLSHEEVLDSVPTAVPLYMLPSPILVLPNDTRTQVFFALPVAHSMLLGDHTHFTTLINAVNWVVEQFHGEAYFEDAQPHVSFAWMPWHPDARAGACDPKVPQDGECKTKERVTEKHVAELEEMLRIYGEQCRVPGDNDEVTESSYVRNGIRWSATHVVCSSGNRMYSMSL